jgi:exoribonuclease R
MFYKTRQDIMPNYKIHIENRYESWKVYTDDTLDEIEYKIEPIKEKLFSDDVFNDDNGVISVVHSTIKQCKSMPGVLMLEKNKTYGKKKNKFLYKCIPDDNRMPIFLLPYEIKNLGFSKKMENKYVTFNYDNWNGQHPQGLLSNVIGDVTKLENFYEYQLFCKSLNASIQNFSRHTAKVLKEKTEEEFIHIIMEKYPTIEDRTENYDVFSIDPNGCGDFDDAFSITKLEDDQVKISIYISNVSIWLDVLNLWESFSDRVATIYLPDRKRPMLPTCLSDCLCSLQENRLRVAFNVDFTIDKNNDIIDVKYHNTLVKLKKNFIYEEKTLLKYDHYILLKEVVDKLCKKYKYINNCHTSHDLVAYLMVLMNCYCSKEMIKDKNGIYRSVLINKSISLPTDLPEDVSKFLTIWGSSSGQYILHSDELKHEILNMDNYIHMTSPIRRLVDLLNMIQFQKNLQMIHLSNSAQEFYDKWINKLSYINITMRAIRKVQCDCNLLHYYTTNEAVLQENYKGYVFDKLKRNDGLYQYIVYLPELKLTSRITLREDKENYSYCYFKLYMFMDESKIKRKIRLMVV